MPIFALIFSILITVIFPIIIGMIFAVKFKSFLAVFLGTSCFLIFQIFTRIPLIQYVLPKFASVIVFQLNHPILYILALSLSAGIFEECGRYIIMKLFMRNSSYEASIAFGIGHGGIESILLVGISLITILVTKSGIIMAYPSSGFLLSAIERIFAMSTHICLSTIIWISVVHNKWHLLPISIFFHGAYNFIPVYMTSLGVNGLVVQGVIAIQSLLLIIYAYYKYKKIKGRIFKK